MRMHVLAPSGTFVPKNLDTDFLLLAAGSGITPMMAICKSALAEGSGKIVLVYANRDENSVIFAAALRELAAKYPDRLTVIHWLETVQGLPSTDALATLLRPYAAHEAFICGPGPFMAAAEAALQDRRRRSTSTSRSSSRWTPTRSPQVVIAVDDEDDRGPGAGRRRTGRHHPRGRLAAQGQAARRPARQGTGRTVLLPRGALRCLRGADEQR